jgi:recombination protein RecT
MSNNTQVAKRMPFSVAVQTDTYKKLINRTLQDPDRAKRFIAAITSAVAVNPALQECDPVTVLSGALLGESLNLPPSPQLGFFYLVPFKEKNPDGSVKRVNATFVLGYKGFVQLALRTGYYQNIEVQPVKEGELKSWNRFTGEFVTVPIEDEDKYEKAPTIGYYAMIEYMNGFKKTLYWSKDKMLNHADRYSPAFKKDTYRLIQEGKIPAKDMWKYSSFWYKEFDDMAMKTMLRQLISKWGMMNTELQSAFTADEKITMDAETFIEPDYDDAEMTVTISDAPLDDTEQTEQQAKAAPKKSGKQVSLNDV